MSDEELLIVAMSGPVPSLVALSDEYVKRQEELYKDVISRQKLV